MNPLTYYASISFNNIKPNFKLDSTFKMLLNSPEHRIIVYTDGSSLNNPGPGGYGIVIQIKDNIYEFSQGYKLTTNNRMEMMAVIVALEKLQKHKHMFQEIIIYSDSKYIINGIVNGWAKGWQKRNWKKADGKIALNPDLWKQLLMIVDTFPRLNFQWVKGHAGNPLNERADKLASKAAACQNGSIVDKGYQNIL